MDRGKRVATCKVCGASGHIELIKFLRGGRAIKVVDYIQHLETCSQYKAPQPAHLKNRASVRKQEKHANNLVGARATLASGALGMDGDGRSLGKWRVEAKQTTKHVYRVTERVWSKLVRGALLAGEEPVLHVQFLTAPHNKVCIVRRDYWDSLCREGPDLNITNELFYPFSMPLDPPAVALLEEDFKRLKIRREKEYGP